MLSVGEGSNLWVLSFAPVISSTIGMFHYLSVIVRMYLSRSEQRPSEPAGAVASGFVLAALTLALVRFGLYPAPLINLIQDVITRLI